METTIVNWGSIGIMEKNMGSDSSLQMEREAQQLQILGVRMWQAL